MHGGYTAVEDAGLSDTHISSLQLHTWAAKASSRKGRRNHACAEIPGDKQVWVGGGRDHVSVEYYSVAGDSWHAGPDLPYAGSVPGAFTTHEGELVYAGGHGNIFIYRLSSDKTGWEKVGQMTNYRHYFTALTISEDLCKGE